MRTVLFFNSVTIFLFNESWTNIKEIFMEDKALKPKTQHVQSSNEIFVKTLKLTLNTKISRRGERERKGAPEETASSLQAKM